MLAAAYSDDIKIFLSTRVDLIIVVSNKHIFEFSNLDFTFIIVVSVKHFARIYRLFG